MANLPNTDSVVLKPNPLLRAEISGIPLVWTLAQAERIIWRVNALRVRDGHNRWQVPSTTQVIESDLTQCGLRLHCSSAQLLANFFVEPNGLRVELSAEDTSQINGIAIDFDARAGEHYIGFGERFNGIDQREREIDLNVLNGASGGKTYKPIPFFISSAGYAVQILSSTRCLVRLATQDDPAVVSIRNSNPSLSFRVFTGNNPKELIQQHASFVSYPPLPPTWVFGPWKSRDWTTENQATVYEDLDQVRQHHLAGTVKLIDAAWESSYNSFDFHATKFPQPEKMIAHTRDLGYRMVFWISPWIVRDEPPSPTYQFCAEKNFLIKTQAGQPYVHRLGNSPTFVGSCIDFTNPDAVAWWKEQIQKIVRMGVAGFKTDFGEQVPEDAIFSDGRTGRELHNLFPRLYNQATYEAMSGLTHGVLLARSAWEGSQAYCAIWAGDQSSDFGPATGLTSVIVSGQSAGISGFPFWASDIGGYFGTPTEEVFIRWIQFGAFSPIMQIHGLGLREPWNFSKSVLEIYRRYAQLHLDLFPYLYTHAHLAHKTGLPIIRALAIEFPDDPGIWGDVAEHEYCFGSDLLVAPVYWGGDRFRFTYLPRGQWRDFWTGQAYEGGTIVRLPASLDTIPVVARAGAILPFLDPSPETLLPTQDANIKQAGNDLRVQVYPGADGKFEMYDGTRFEWQDATHTLRVHSPSARFVSAKILGENFALAYSIAHETGNLNGDSDFVRVQVQPNQDCDLVWLTMKT